MQLVSEGDTPFMSALVRSNRIAYRSSDHPSAFSGAVLASSSTATSICEYTGSIGSSLRIFWIVAHEASQFPVVRICSTASRTRGNWEASWATIQNILKEDPIEPVYSQIDVAVDDEASTAPEKALGWSDERYAILLDRTKADMKGVSPSLTSCMLRAG